MFDLNFKAEFGGHWFHAVSMSIFTPRFSKNRAYRFSNFESIFMQPVVVQNKTDAT